MVEIAPSAPPPFRRPWPKEWWRAPFVVGFITLISTGKKTVSFSILDISYAITATLKISEKKVHNFKTLLLCCIAHFEAKYF